MTGDLADLAKVRRRRRPRCCATGGGRCPGHGEPATERELQALGMRTVAIPRRARPSAARRAVEHGRACRTLVRSRTGCEGRISYLKRGYGWDRTRLDGHDGASIFPSWIKAAPTGPACAPAQPWGTRPGARLATHRNATKVKQAHPVTAQAPRKIRPPRQPAAQLAALRTWAVARA